MAKKTINNRFDPQRIVSQPTGSEGKNDLITIRVARFLPLFAIKIHVELMTLNI